jgi:hypothetical protein
LTDQGVTGNSHFMTREETNHEPFALIHGWLGGQ